MKLAADGLRRLTEFGAKHDINVIVENHGGLSSNGEWLAGVMKMVNCPNCGTLPDFGNFRSSDTTYDHYKGVAELMPYAKAVSAKSHDFDADGQRDRNRLPQDDEDRPRRRLPRLRRHRIGRRTRPANPKASGSPRRCSKKSGLNSPNSPASTLREMPPWAQRRSVTSGRGNGAAVAARVTFCLPPVRPGRFAHSRLRFGYDRRPTAPSAPPILLRPILYSNYHLQPRTSHSHRTLDPGKNTHCLRTRQRKPRPLSKHCLPEHRLSAC